MSTSRPVAFGSQYHEFVPQEKAAEDIFGPRTTAAASPAPMQGLHVEISIATGDSSTVLDMLNELRHRLHPVLREQPPEPSDGRNKETETERSCSPMAQDIREVSICLNDCMHIINDIISRLEV